MKPTTNQKDADAAVESMESLVTEAVDEFMEASERGEQPSIDDYAHRFPSIADILRKVLPAVDVMRTGALTSAGGPSSTKRFPEMDGCLGDYRLLREIGRGGMGVVYEAEQISLQRTVALKVLPFAAALDSKRLERFKNEAQAAARLHHSNIVPVHAVGCERGVYYYAMQLIDGESLCDVIEQLKKLHRPGQTPRDFSARSTLSPPQSSDKSNSLGDTADHVGDPIRATFDVEMAASMESSASHGTADDAATTDTVTQAQAPISTVQSNTAPAFFKTAAELGIQAAEALEHAHSHDVVHRDIKPANLLVDPRGVLWVTDFGLARLLSDAGVTVTGDVVGTLRYMSPEQANGKKGVVDHLTDIYSLGATLYELLTLQPVFDGSNREELLKQVTFDDPVAPRRHNRAIPTDLETIVLKCLAKESHGRYSTARELADDLRRFLDSRPIRAKRPTLVELTSKWTRRHMPVVVSAVVVLVLAVIGLTVSNVLIAREQAKTSDAFTKLESQQAKTAAAYDEIKHQQEMTNAALAEEAKQRTLAQQHFSQALGVLEFFIKIAEVDLADKPEMQEVRSSLLQASLQYYQNFIEQSGDNPPLQAVLAQSHLQVARILHEIGSTTGALEALEQALRTQEDLVKRRPEDSSQRSTLWEMHKFLGTVRGLRELEVVTDSRVQQHLNLTQQQIDAVEAIAARKRRKDHVVHESDHFTNWRKYTLQQLAEAQAAIASILNDQQAKRFRQLVLQCRSTCALNDPSIAAELGLTDAQMQTIHSIQGERGGCNRRRIYGVLTDEQEKKWRELVGEPFKFDLKRNRKKRA